MRGVIRFNPVSTTCSGRYILLISVFITNKRHVLNVVKREELTPHLSRLLESLFFCRLLHPLFKQTPKFFCLAGKKHSHMPYRARITLFIERARVLRSEERRVGKEGR